MLQDNANSGQGEGGREKNRRDDIPVTAREGMSAESTQMDLDPVPNWTLDMYCRECATLMDIKRFSDMARDGKNLVMYDRHLFELDTALSVWKSRWAVLC